MKKVLVLILAVLYVTITSGVMVNIHYCMGQFTSVNYGVDHEKPCDRCGMEQKKDCCHTEHKLIKSDDEHLSVKGISSPAIFISQPPVLYDVRAAVTYRINSHRSAVTHSPPGAADRSLTVYHCVFRI